MKRTLFGITSLLACLALSSQGVAQYQNLIPQNQNTQYQNQQFQGTQIQNPYPNNQYSTQQQYQGQQTLLPSYPSTNSAYPLNNTPIQSRPVSIPQQETAPGPSGQNSAPVRSLPGQEQMVQQQVTTNGQVVTNNGCNPCHNGYASGPVNIYNQGNCGAPFGANLCNSYAAAYPANGCGNCGGNVYNNVVGQFGQAMQFNPGCGTNNGCGPVGGIGGGLGGNMIGGNLVGGGCGQVQQQGGNTNRVFGLRGLVFARDYEDDRGLSFNPTTALFSTDADFNAMGGFEAFFAIRRSNCTGFEGVYWGIFPSTADVNFTGAQLYTAIPYLNQLSFGGFTGQGIFDNAINHRIYRDNEFHNIELNILRNAGCVQGFMCGNMNLELLGGVRYFKFDESFRYSAFGGGAYPPEFHYDLEVENDMLGFQVGGRAEQCLNQCLKAVVVTKFGLYNNRIYHRQSVSDGNLNYATINVGNYASQPYMITSNKSDLAFLGEMDFSLAYEVNCNTRVNIGYRIVTVGGVAHAIDQIPDAFQDILEAGRIESNGSLILHGAYAGLDICF